MKYVCQICGYVYDESREKVPFADLPETWKCPLCGAAKSDFKAEDAKAEAAPSEDTKTESAPAPTPAAAVAETADGKLSMGQLAALCSNLARGCEKQYMNDEAESFRQLADYFTSVTPPVQDATVESIDASLKQDIEEYPNLQQIAGGAGDRGAARALTWGEKVSRILSTLVERYQEKGEAMMDGQNVWVCTACGFVYVGESVPEICPVCKVPSWKFEEIREG